MYEHVMVETLSGTFNAILGGNVYPTKKETHHYDFPIEFSFLYENVNCHEIFISDQI